MDYIEQQKEFYKNYVAIDFDNYVEFKRKDGTWGDDLEIQALSEMYQRPILIFAYAKEPL